MSKSSRTGERAFGEMLAGLVVICGLITLALTFMVADFANNLILSAGMGLSVVLLVSVAASLLYVQRSRHNSVLDYADHCRHHVGQMAKHYTGLADAQKQLAGPPLLQTIEEIIASGMTALAGHRCQAYFRRVTIGRGGASVISHFIDGIEDDLDGNPAFDRFIKGLAGEEADILIADIDDVWANQFASLPEMEGLSADADLLPLLGPQIGRGWHMPWKSFVIVPVKVHPVALQKRAGKGWAEQADEAGEDAAEQPEKLVGYLSIACDARNAFDVKHVVHDAKGYAHMLGELLIAISQIESTADEEMVD